MDEAPPSRPRRRGLKLTAAVLGTVVLVGVPSAVALYLSLSRGSGDQLVRMVPANADVYATVLLDPSLSQKRNLESFLEHFPKLHSQQAIQDNIDSSMSDSLKSLGLDYKRDVLPWLGNQVAGVVQVGGGGSQPAGAVLVRSKDDAAAARAVARIKSSDGSNGLQWSVEQHGGVDVTVGRYHSGDAHATSAYAVFDHVVVVASDPALVDSIIDTDHGKQAALNSLQAYKDTLQRLPGDTIGSAYVNAGSLIATLKKSISGDTANQPQFIRDAMSSLDAYRSMGAAVSAQSDAMALDSVTLTDPGKLSSRERAALTRHQKPVSLRWMPESSFAVVAGDGDSSSSGLPLALAAIAGLTMVGRQTNHVFTNVSNGLEQPSTEPVPGGMNAVVTPPPDGAMPTLSPQPDPMQGITQIANHLTGDAALSVGPAHGSLPVSAVLALGLDDTSAVDGLVRDIGTSAGGTWADTQDGAVVLHTLTLPRSDATPAYATFDGYAVVATDPDTLRAAVDAHNGSAPGVSSSATFHSSPAGNATGGLLFVDFPALFKAVDAALSGSDRADFDQNTLPDVKPLRVLTVTSSGDARAQQTHVLLTVGG